MATSSKTTTSSAPADMADIGNQITSNLAAADDIGARRVQTLAWVHQARAAQLSRTAVSLKAQYGPNDPGVKSAEAAVAAANATAAQVAVVHHQVTTADPQVAANGWALHGRVLDAQLAPAFGYTVFLVDSAKNYQQAYGFAYTDPTGYFMLNYPGTAGASAGTPAGASGQTPEAAPQAAATPELFVEVVDTKGRPVFLSTTAFRPVIGSATYQNVVLPAGQQPIGDPPPVIRQVAIPKPGGRRSPKR
jgi:hypothetical protein